MSGSYQQIMRSSSIMGAAQAVNYLVALVRVKIVAVLLGPSGVGLVALYASATGMVGAFTNLGIHGSGVREVSAAYSREDPAAAARSVLILRRVSWFTGILGWLVALALAVPLSRWIAGSAIHASAIALLGCTLLIGAISGGQLALLQGLRRIGDIARASVLGVLVNTLVAVGLYAWLGQDGIVPVLICSALVTLTLSYWFARRVRVPVVELTWRDTITGASSLLRIGAAFMWSAVLVAGMDLFVRSLISRHFGLEASGIYQAAWALSGLFAAFILQAMGADYYPRLTSMIDDRVRAIETVNHQTEIGVLLALPGLLATLAFAPWVIGLFYSRDFSPASGLLPWMVLGVFGRIVSWPLGYIQLALGNARWFALTEAVFFAIQAGLQFWLVPRFGVFGAGYAFALTYLLYVIGMLWVGRRLLGFGWSSDVVKLIVASSLLVVAGFSSSRLLTPSWRLGVGTTVCLIGTLLSLRGLVRRLGPDHGLSRLVAHIPGGRLLFHK